MTSGSCCAAVRPSRSFPSRAELLLLLLHPRGWTVVAGLLGVVLGSPIPRSKKTWNTGLAPWVEPDSRYPEGFRHWDKHADLTLAVSASTRAHWDSERAEVGEQTAVARPCVRVTMKGGGI